MICASPSQDTLDIPAGDIAEQQRLSALRGLNILDSDAEPEFDDLVSLTAAICGVPVSLVSLIDGNRQWFKAAIGTAIRETPRAISFCHHAIQQSDIFLVEDAMTHETFAQNPLVTGEEQWRFYAGFPLRVGDGLAVGTLCVVDHRPRTLSNEQRTALRILADQVTARLELRAKQRDMEIAFREKDIAHAETRRVEQRFQQFMDNGPFLGFIKDAAGRMLYYNQPLANRFGVSRQAFLGKSDSDLWPADLAAEYRDHDLTLLAAEKLTVTQEKTQNGDGTYSTWQSFKFPCRGEAGELLLGGVSVDITEHLLREEQLLRVHKELQQANLLLEKLAATDALTGLATRRLFDEHLRSALRKASENVRPLSLFMIDVDNFKRHNDSFGHQHGDAVLQEIASCVKVQLRPTDLVARYGGEEFAMIAEGISSVEIRRIAERLLTAVRALRINNQGVTISIGVATSSTEALHSTDLVSLADEALFVAKRNGKDRVEFAPRRRVPRRG